MFKKVLYTLTLCLCSYQAMADDKINVCATSQMYNALSAIAAARDDMNTYFASGTDLYAQISNNDRKCNILISSDEKLPIQLIRSNRAEAASMLPLVRAPLVLWSKNPRLFNNGSTKAISDRQLESLAIAKTELTPVGFATHQIVSKSAFPTNYIKNKLFRAEHEYEVYSMVDSENVQAGFVSKPLVTSRNRMANGSYWVVPKDYHADILYYITIVDKAENTDKIVDLYKFLKENKSALESYEIFGFENLNSAENKGQSELKGFK